MKTMFKSIPAITACILFLTAFTSLPGGEGFEVYLNDKLVVQQYGAETNSVKSVNLAKTTVNDKMKVKYWHCGKTGSERTLTIRDAHDKIIKTFRYPDTKSVSAMEFPVKDLATYKGSLVLKLYYSSAELPKGRMLASIQTGVPALATR